MATATATTPTITRLELATAPCTVCNLLVECGSLDGPKDRPRKLYRAVQTNAGTCSGCGFRTSHRPDPPAPGPVTPTASAEAVARVEGGLAQVHQFLAALTAGQQRIECRIANQSHHVAFGMAQLQQQVQQLCYDDDSGTGDLDNQAWVEPTSLPEPLMPSASMEPVSRLVGPPSDATA